MIDRSHFGYTVYCDMCDRSLEVETDSFSDVVDELKEEGWISKKEDGDWVHLCNFCKDK